MSYLLVPRLDSNLSDSIPLLRDILLLDNSKPLRLLRFLIKLVYDRSETKFSILDLIILRLQSREDKHLILSHYLEGVC